MKRTFDISAFCINEDECWFFANNFNCLFYKKIDSGKTEIYGPVPWEPENRGMLYKEMEYVNGKIYLIPFKARSIAVYDIAKKEYYKIELDPQMVIKNGNLFRAGLVYNEYIYAFGIHSPTIIVVNTIDDSIEYLTSWYEDVKDCLIDSSKALFRKQLAIHEKKAYIPMVYGDIVLSIDLETKKVVINHLKFESVGYVGITNNGENIYLASRDGDGFVGCWNCNTKEEKIIGRLHQEGAEVNKYLSYDPQYIEVYYMESHKNLINDEKIHSEETDCDCLICNGQATAFFCDDGKVLLIKNGVKQRIDVSVEISTKDKERLSEVNSFIKEKKWYGLKQLIGEIIEE